MENIIDSDAKITHEALSAKVFLSIFNRVYSNKCIQKSTSFHFNVSDVL